MAESRYCALLLGNGTFPDGSGLKCLNGPPNDVKELKGALTDQDTGLFEADDVTAWSDLDSSDMRVAISDFFDAAHCEDQLLLYYTGHGLLSAKWELHLAAKDTWDTHRRVATGVSAQFIHEVIDGSSARAPKSWCSTAATPVRSSPLRKVARLALPALEGGEDG